MLFGGANHTRTNLHTCCVETITAGALALVNTFLPTAVALAWRQALFSQTYITRYNKCGVLSRLYVVSSSVTSGICFSENHLVSSPANLGQWG